MVYADKVEIINLVNRLFSRSGLTIDQVVGRMQARGCSITRGTFENQFTTRVERKPNIPSDWTLAVVAAFTERLTDQERCTATEAIELARLTQLPIDQFSTLAQLFPPDEFDTAYQIYAPHSNHATALSSDEPVINNADNQADPKKQAKADVLAAEATAARPTFKLWHWVAIAGIAVGTVVIVGLAWLILSQRQQLATERRATLSRQLAGQAIDQLPHRLDLALLLSAAAYQTADTFAARDSLLTALQTSPHLDTYLRGHQGWVWDTAFSADGRTLASTGAGGKIIFWDVATQRPLLSPLTHPGSWARAVAFSPNRNILASGSADGRLTLWDVSGLVNRTDATGLNMAEVTPKPLAPPLTGHTGFITAVAFSPNGRVLASSSADGTVRLWDVPTGREIGTSLTGHVGWVLDVAFSPDGAALASAGSDETIILWDVSDTQTMGQPLAYALTGHQGSISSIAFSPDGQTLASSSADQTIRLWDVEARRPRGQPLSGHQGTINRVVFSPDGQLLASAGDDKSVMLWNARSGQMLEQPLLGHTDTILSLAFSPDGQTLVSGSADSTVILWDANQTQPLAQLLAGHIAAVRGLSFGPSDTSAANTVLASSSNDFTLTLWDTTTKQPLGPPLTGHAGLVSDVAFSPDGQMLASSGDDRNLLLWDTKSGQRLGWLLKNYRHPLHNLSVSPVGFADEAGPVLAASDENANVMLWGLNSRQPVKMPPSLKGKPVHFSPDGQFLAAAYGPDINVFDVAANQLLAPLKGHLNPVRSLAFSPNSQILASGGEDKTIFLWDVSTGQPLTQPLLGHAAAVWSLAFSPDGRLLASGTEDGQVLLWDVSPLFDADGASPRLLGRPLINGDRVWRVAFSLDGRVLASAGRNDGNIIVWDVDPETWLTRVCDTVTRNLTLAEWQRYVGRQPYRSVCPNVSSPPNGQTRLAVPTAVVTPPLPETGQAGQSGRTVPIVEKFDSAQGFIQTSDNVYIDDGQVRWHIQRNGGKQFVYRTIPPFAGNVRLTVRGQVDSWTNNCGVRAGIGNGAGSGLSVVMGWTGGGCANNGPFVEAKGVVLDHQIVNCDDFNDDWLWIKPGKPYTVSLTVKDEAANLAVEGIGNLTGTVDYEGPYTTLWVGYSGDGDWPECGGKINSMMVEPLD